MIRAGPGSEPFCCSRAWEVESEVRSEMGWWRRFWSARRGLPQGAGAAGAREVTGIGSVTGEAGRFRDVEMQFTGWWETPEGDVALVRYDPVIRRFSLDGRVWPEVGALAAYLRFCERHEGWTPLPDEVTERVRGWVGV